MVSGIHYNFSFPESFWLTMGIQTNLQKLRLLRHDEKLPQILVASIYLFGGSPVADSSLVTKNPPSLVEMAEGFIGLPFATCLRMSDVGYVSAAQENLDISYNSIEAYCEALPQP